MSANVIIEPATEADLDELSEMLGELFTQESDFRPDKEKQLRGLRLIFEQPSRGRVFVRRRDCRNDQLAFYYQHGRRRFRHPARGSGGPQRVSGQGLRLKTSPTRN